MQHLKEESYSTQRVTVSAGPDPGDDPDPVAHVLVSVDDTGRGMDSEELMRAQRDFYTTKEDGTGLGLTIVRRLVMDLGGSVSFDSAAGEGTRVRMRFPSATERG